MAAPGQFNYFLTGQPIYFLNSNDNKVFLTGFAPTATVDDAGIVRPSVGSLSISPQTPVTIGTVEVPVGNLVLDGKQVGQHIVKPTLRTVSLAGAAPSLAIKVFPTKKSLVLTEFNPARWTGLWFEGFKPTSNVGNVTAPTVGACSFASVKPDVSISTPTATVRVPDKQSVTLSGAAPSGVTSHITLPTTGALVAFGRLVRVNDVVFPGRGSVTAAGFQPIPDIPGGEVSVIIEGPFNPGTIIENRNATFDSKHRYTIDQRTGFKVKVRKGYPLQEEWTGIHTADPDPPEHQLRVQQTKTRYKQGAIRREPIGNETFIETPVDPDDL